MKQGLVCPRLSQVEHDDMLDGRQYPSKFVESSVWLGTENRAMQSQ